MLLALAVPVLAAKCLSCHSAEAKTGGLDLSTREAMLRGGKSGPAIAAGDPSASLLMKQVTSGKMPPGKPLETAEVDALREWIAKGAEWGPEAKLTSARPRAGLDWWALRSPEKPAVPVIEGASNPIDAFLLAKLREKGLDYSPEASPAALLRRLHFAVTGLPPKPEEFTEPYQAAVTRLLRSPHYGESWARYWLDIVRFGESDGGEHNNERMTAWKYRDYVIDAFQSGKPYDRFVREQIAGDLIAPGDPKLTAATGFLVCGPWDSVSKFTNRDETFRKMLRQDELDDMVTTTTATFLGLTVGCARCHDHKFDPIPQKDYYRLTAAFRGITFGERDVTSGQKRTDRETLLAPLRKEQSRARKELGEIEDAPRARLLTAKLKAAEMPRGPGVKHVQLNPVFNRNKFAPVRASRFRMAITDQTGKSAPRIDRLELLPAGHVVSNWQGTKPGTDDAPQYLEMELTMGAEVSEIVFSSDRERGAKEGSVRVYRLEYPDAGGAWRTAASMLDHEVPAEVALPEVSEDEVDAAIPESARGRRRELTAAIKDLQARMDSVPALDTVHAAKLEPEMTPAFVLDRGSVTQPKDEVTPGALSAILQLTADLPNGSDAERRLALAAWLADPRNPLTARVLVNRVWHRYFGSGLVNTPSDLGFNGDRPSHPELLDWLAASFVENGWSLEWLHRQILGSRAFRQDSRMNAKAFAIDASNRLLWRMSPRRMDAETLRDSILAVSGSLNLERGGPSFLLQKKETRGSYLYRTLDNDGPAVWRRAVYKFVARGGERVFLDSFDCPDPSVATPQRAVSNTPVQALTLLNNSFVMRQAELLAKRVREEAGESRRAQVERAHRLVLGRDPGDRERELAAKFLEAQSLALYCRALLNTNEFVYVP